MTDNEFDMPCAPVDPRRPPVPGLEGEKFATEDYIEVGDQASMAVNATGSNKKFVQQAFHRSFFITRPRSASLGNIKNTTTGENILDASNINEEENTDLSGPPDWQRIPTLRNPKRRKTSTSPPPERVYTNNRFHILPVESVNENEISGQVRKISKPPPIILYGIENINKLTDLLVTAANQQQFSYKIVNRNQLRISCVDVETYKSIISVIRENQLIGHTFNRKDQRCHRLVIRNLHHSTPHEAIRAAFENTGNSLAGEIINAKYGADKKPTSTFFINLLPGPNIKLAKDIKVIY